MKTGDRLHGFEVVRVSASGMLLTWWCATCGHPAQLLRNANLDWMREHDVAHQPPLVWPFPVYAVAGKPTSPI